MMFVFVMTYFFGGDYEIIDIDMNLPIFRLFLGILQP